MWRAVIAIRPLDETDARLGFPWRTRHLLLPSRPRRATAAGLSLYDATLLHQRLAVRLADVLVRAGVTVGLHTRSETSTAGLEFLERWFVDRAGPETGHAAHAALVAADDRAHALILSGVGRPIAFLKARRKNSDLYRPSLEQAALELLHTSPPSTFRAPGLRRSDDFDGWHVQVFDPLPEGLHRRPPHDPGRVADVVSELQELLAPLASLHQGSPTVVCHGDLTPRNLRLASDGRLWLIDWEYARRGPRLADELRYWTVEFATRRPRSIRRRSRRIVELLRRRGSTEEIARALRWGDYLTPDEQRLREAVRSHMETETASK